MKIKLDKLEAVLPNGFKINIGDLEIKTKNEEDYSIPQLENHTPEDTLNRISIKETIKSIKWTKVGIVVAVLTTFAGVASAYFSN